MNKQVTNNLEWVHKTKGTYTSAGYTTNYYKADTSVMEFGLYITDKTSHTMFISTYGESCDHKDLGVVTIKEAKKIAQAYWEVWVVNFLAEETTLKGLKNETL